MEGTYRSIYKKKRTARRLFIIKPAIHGYTNLPPKRRRLSSSLLQSSRFSIISESDLENDTQPGNTMEILAGKIARRHVQDQYGKSNRRIASESALKKRFVHLRFYQLHTLLSYFSATSHVDRNAQINFRNGRWKYSLLSATIQAYLSTCINAIPFSVWQTYEKNLQKPLHTNIRTHVHIYANTYARICIPLDTSAQCTLAITDYSSTERMCIQHQRSSYVTITTAIYTDYYRIAGRAKFTGPLEKIRRNRDSFFVELDNTK